MALRLSGSPSGAGECNQVGSTAVSVQARNKWAVV